MLTSEEQSAEAEIKFEPFRSNGRRTYRMLERPKLVYDKYNGLTYNEYQDKLTEEIILEEPRRFSSLSRPTAPTAMERD